MRLSRAAARTARPPHTDAGPSSSSPPSSSAVDPKLALGYLGAALLFCGLFLPALRLPAGTSVNVFWGGCAAGVLLLLLAAGSAAALAARRFWALWLTGTGSLVWIGGSLVRSLEAVSRLDGAGAAAHAAGDAPTGLPAAADVLLRASSQVALLEWAWPVLFLGALLVIVAAEVGRRQGAAIPRPIRTLMLAAASVAVLLLVGPPVMSATHWAWSEMREIERREAREPWLPHDTARAVMANTRAQVREREERERRRASDEERERREAAAVLAAERAARVREVAAVRRWYPALADSLRPVLALYGARLAASAIDPEEAVVPLPAGELRAEPAGFPESPDPEMNAILSRLFTVHAEPRACAGGPPGATASTLRKEVLPAGFAAVEHGGEPAHPCVAELGMLLDQLAVELASYCLELPGRLPGGLLDVAPAGGAAAGCAVEPRLEALASSRSTPAERTGARNPSGATGPR